VGFTLSVQARGVVAYFLFHEIVMVTTGAFAQSVAAFAAQLMMDGPLQVVLVDGDVLVGYRRGGSQAIQRYFRSQAMNVFTRKQGQLEEEAIE
jgi:hypothetical protein